MIVNSEYVFFIWRPAMNLSFIVSGFFTFIGIGLSAIGIYLTLSGNKKIRDSKTIDWIQIHVGSRYLSKKIVKDKFAPDYILAPGPRSSIIAQEIANNLNEELPIFTGFVSKENLFNNALDNDFVIIQVNQWYLHLPLSVKSLKGKNVLIVQDWILSGESLEHIKKKLLELGYEEERIRCCAIAVTQVPLRRKHRPNYYYKVVDPDECYFPWGKAR